LVTEQVTWEDFLRRFKWKQGEHVTIIGTTGAGKTVLIREILHKRNYILLLATKKRDKSLNPFIRRMHFVEQPIFIPEMAHKIIIKPDRWPSDVDRQRWEHHQLYKDVLQRAFDMESWTVVCDEMLYMCEFLSLQAYFERLWYQGRSLKLTLVAATQKPKHIPLSAYSMARHLFFFQESDESNLRRLSEIDSRHVSKRDLMNEIKNLPEHDFIYLNARTGLRLQSRVPSELVAMT
jgi:Cdc6-like AAA superfamily ATPase